MKKTRKAILSGVVSLVLLLSLFVMLPLGAAAETNLITSDTPITLINGGDVEGKWTWENGVLASTDMVDEGANVVFKIDGLDNNKTYRYAGTIKILEFNADTGWYGPRLIFRAKNREDIANVDYAALTHFQNTEVFINNFINATTLPYEVVNVRATVNKEIPFEIYVSPDKTVVYYDGRLRFTAENSSRVKALPYAFGAWSIGTRLELTNLSLSESEIPSGDTPPTGNGGDTSQTEAPPVTSNGGESSADEQSQAPDDESSATESTKSDASQGGVVSKTSTPTTKTSDKSTDGKPSGNNWVVPVIIAVIVVLAAAAVLFYLFVIRKKPTAPTDPADSGAHDGTDSGTGDDSAEK